MMPSSACALANAASTSSQACQRFSKRYNARIPGSATRAAVGSSSAILCSCSGGEHCADVGQVFAAPEQLAIDDKGRYAEHADRLGGTRHTVDLARSVGCRIG